MRQGDALTQDSTAPLLVLGFSSFSSSGGASSRLPEPINKYPLVRYSCTHKLIHWWLQDTIVGLLICPKGGGDINA